MIAADSYDLSVIGGGISGSLVVIKLLQSLEISKANQTSPKRIVIFDRMGDFGAGIPYGEKSSEPGFLLIDTVAKSTPPEFQTWLKAKRNELIAELQAQTDTAVKTWLSENRAALSEGKIDELFVPRRLFGKYITDLLFKQIRQASDAGLASIKLVHDEVVDLKPLDTRGFIVSTQTETFFADTTVVAVGNIPRAAHSELSVTDGYIHDLWEQGYSTIDLAINKISARLGRPLDLVISGSGATAGEVVYYLAHAPKLLPALRSIQVVSRSGYLAGGGAGSATNMTEPPKAYAVARPAAREYTSAASRLTKTGLLSSLLAKIEPTPKRTEDGRLALPTDADNKCKVFADIIVNCMGSGILRKTRSPLLSAMCLPERGFRINHLGVGFKTSDGAAHPNGCFVIGPLQNLEAVETHVESIHGVYRATAELNELLCKRLEIHRPMRSKGTPA